MLPQAYTADDLNSFLRRLKAIGAVKIDFEKRFRFKHHEKFPDAPLSPTYVSLRVPENNGVLQPVDVETVARFMYYYLRKNGITFDGICGLPRAGEPYAEALQNLIYQTEHLFVPRITLGKDEGPSGRKIGKILQVQGLPRGRKVLLLDDLISRALTKLEGAETLEGAGYVVEDMMVFLDREQGGAQELGTRGKKLHSIVSFTSMFCLYREDGLPQADYDEIMRYQESERALPQAA